MLATSRRPICLHRSLVLWFHWARDGVTTLDSLLICFSASDLTQIAKSALLDWSFKASKIHPGAGSELITNIFNTKNCFSHTLNCLIVHQAKAHDNTGNEIINTWHCWKPMLPLLGFVFVVWLTSVQPLDWKNSAKLFLDISRWQYQLDISRCEFSVVLSWNSKLLMAALVLIMQMNRRTKQMVS